MSKANEPGPMTREGLSRRGFLKATAAGAAVVGSTSLLPGLTSPAAASGPKRSASSGPKRGGTLRAALSGGDSLDTINPLVPVNNVDFARISQLYDPLVVFDANALPQLQLAEEISPNADATVWTIRLRRGVTFHNGKPVTADDVIYTFQQILNPKSPGSGAPSLQSVDLKRITKLDNLTVRVPCISAFATFVQVLAAYYFDIIPVGFDPKHPIGTGPFRFESFTPGVQSTFTRNDNYWQAGLPHFDSVVISDYADETSQVNALLSNQADVVNLLSSSSVAAIRSGGAEVLVSDGGGWTPFTMRVDQAPFNDVRVRQAMRLICDRPQMLDLVFLGSGTLGNDIFGVWDPAYDHALPQRHQDLAQARHLLKQAGHSDLTVQLVTANLAQGVESVAQVFAQQAKGAGVNVTIKPVSVTEFYGPSYLKWTFAQDYWFYNPYFPQVALGSLPTAPYNETHWDNPRYDALFHEGLRTVNESKRADIAHEMQLIDYDSGGYIIPYFPPVIDGYATRVKGTVRSKTGISFNDFDFKNMWFA